MTVAGFSRVIAAIVVWIVIAWASAAVCSSSGVRSATRSWVRRSRPTLPREIHSTANPRLAGSGTEQVFDVTSAAAGEGREQQRHTETPTTPPTLHPHDPTLTIAPTDSAQGNVRVPALSKGPRTYSGLPCSTQLSTS